MERSEQIDQLATALAKFQGELKQPKLNQSVSVQTRSGRSYSFKYADLNACKEAAQKPLAENGLAVTQLVEADYSLTTMLLHSSGQWLSSNVKMPITDQGAQAVGSAITYAKRYAFCAILGIVADDDDDGNLSQGNSPQKENKPANKPQSTASPSKQPVRKEFNPQLLEREDFFQRICAYEAGAKEKGNSFSLKAFMENVYTIDEASLKMVEEKYTDWKINNSK